MSDFTITLLGLFCFLSGVLLGGLLLFFIFRSAFLDIMKK